MDAINFDVNEAIRQYDTDLEAIDTPGASKVLLECELEPESLNSPALMDEALNPVEDEVTANGPASIARSDCFDTLQFLLKFSSHIPLSTLGRILGLLVETLSKQTDFVLNDIKDEDQDALKQDKIILEICGFLLRWTISAVEARALEKPASAPAARGRGKAKATAARNDDTWDPSPHLKRALEGISKLLNLKQNLNRILVTTPERDTFINLFTKPVYYILENEARVKNNEIRERCFKVLCVAVKFHGHAYTAQNSINQCLTYFEHLSEPMAQFLHILANEYDYPQLTHEVLRDVSSKVFSKEDLKGPKSISTFLTRISEVLPDLVIKQMTLLANLLESESYTLRCSMIDVCGNLILMISREPDSERSENHQIQLDYYFDVLADRFLDVNPYCRCRVMQAYIKICDLENKYPKRRQEATAKAARCLQDKSTHVRRNAIKLLSKLVITHPFGIYPEDGGQLDVKKWTARLDECTAEMDALRPPEPAPEDQQMVDESMLEEATQAEAAAPEEPTEAKRPEDMTEEEKAVLMEKMEKMQEQVENALKLDALGQKRKLFTDALKFIGRVDEAAENVMQLLNAKNKGEVIEAMDFFRIMDNFKIPNARQGIKRMLRLIWTKGNNEEGKGISTHLIECYRDLFFIAPPHCDQNDAAKYITQNMITLTYGTTPAELISLEQLLSTMMTQGLVNVRVIEKLWSIYGHPKGKSRTQRRGAIIVLGMLALASPGVIIDEMEQCLRIGLGELGRSDLALARYTCIALSRMIPSVSKQPAVDTPAGKGSDLEAPQQIAKLANDHAVLVKLASMCSMVSEDNVWFGVAEQALNAIYALSRHPDVLCSEIIRRKTKFVFAPQAPSRPTSSGSDAPGSDQLPVSQGNEEGAPRKGQNSAIILSQLLFIVGHVAIKQIVHLELCEMEFKRRKTETEKKSSRKSTASEASSSGRRGRKSNASRASTATPGPDQGDDLDAVAGGSTEEEFTEAMIKIREEELLHGEKSLLAIYGPLVSEICANNTSYNHPTLVAQAALCLGKLMCLSPTYCQQNMTLLLTILERSKDPVVRSNLVIALADVAIQFSFMVDENENFLFRRLDDKDPSVKRTCLMTLTLLILSRRVKVKGELGEMAKAMEDDDKRIADMARTFFAEFATKDNDLYNQFIDMFSVLSSDKNLDEDAFKRIIKVVAGHIEKEKFQKNLAQNLAKRLQIAKNEAEWNKIAYTLGQLQHKDEEIQNLISEGCKIIPSQV